MAISACCFTRLPAPAWGPLAWLFSNQALIIYLGCKSTVKENSSRGGSILSPHHIYILSYVPLYVSNHNTTRLARYEICVYWPEEVFPQCLLLHQTSVERWTRIETWILTSVLLRHSNYVEVLKFTLNLNV